MIAKLHIDVAHGVLEVEGEESFVQGIYLDFKAHVFEQMKNAARADREDSASDGEDVGGKTEPAKRKSGTQKLKSSDGGRVRKSGGKPKLNTSLNLAKLASFYDGFSPKNHPEKILIFSVFLRDELNLSTCSLDDIFTCYSSLKGRTATPVAFAKNISDAKSAGYIGGESNGSLSVTTAGDNHFHLTLERKTGVEK
ncbi:MAG: hypothetical protein RH982_18250 [Parvibaculum sp.]|uniref:hypothetical protein n=1 Tax=Parvibaculum sp. TaxID=2024848 RepID=UPI0032EDDF57